MEPQTCDVVIVGGGLMEARVTEVADGVHQLSTFGSERPCERRQDSRSMPGLATSRRRAAENLPLVRQARQAPPTVSFEPSATPRRARPPWRTSTASR